MRSLCNQVTFVCEDTRPLLFGVPARKSRGAGIICSQLGGTSSQNKHAILGMEIIGLLGKSVGQMFDAHDLVMRLCWTLKTGF